MNPLSFSSLQKYYNRETAILMSGLALELALLVHVTLKETSILFYSLNFMFFKSLQIYALKKKIDNYTHIQIAIQNRINLIFQPYFVKSEIALKKIKAG